MSGMKRIALLLALTMALVLAGCQPPAGGSDAPGTTVTPSADTDGLY